MTGAGGFIAGSIVGKLLLDKTGWDSSVSAVGKDEEKLKVSAKRIGESFSAIGKSMILMGGSITAAFGIIITKAANAGDAIYDLSQRTGISTELLSGYKLAAEKSGSSLEGLATGMRGLARVMNDANTGLAESKRAFDALGVSYADNAGNLRPLNDVMLDVADKFSKMPDGAQKTALAMEIFGRSGMELIPMLNMGKKGLEDDYEITKRLGGIWSKEAAQAADAFKDRLAELKLATAGLGKEIGTALLPMVQGFATAVTNIIGKLGEWMRAHPGLTTVVGGTGLAIGGVLTVAGTFLVVAGTLITKFGVLAAAFHTTTAAIALSTAAFTAATAAVGIYAIKLIELSAAEDYEAEATKRAAGQENILVDKLSEASIAAGWHYGQMSKLIEAYDGNIAALTMAIQKGKEGKDIQEALARVSGEHKKKLDEQKKVAGSRYPSNRQWLYSRHRIGRK